VTRSVLAGVTGPELCPACQNPLPPNAPVCPACGAVTGAGEEHTGGTGAVHTGGSGG
jgi:predicted amidophosphoribosyltransferase